MGQAQPQPGAQLGGYEIVRAVGAGQSARVFEARSARGESVAIKLLTADGPIDEQAVGPRFRREIDILRRISHLNVIRLLDSGVDDVHGPYLVMPMVAGKTWRELSRGEPMCPEAALLLLVHLAAGVGALHRAGLVHRDLKPENAMLTDDGRVVLIDLGLALSPDQTRYTAEGAVVGSVPYMSPEQIEGDALTPASDVWSLGVIAYELVAGARPFQRARHSEEVAAVLAGNAPPLGDKDRRLSPAYIALVEQCLSRDPTARPRDAGAVEALASAQLDWLTPGAIHAELTALAADPAGYQARVTPARVATLAELARDAIDRRDPFAATRAIDRGLAYAPEDETLTELAERAISAAQPKPATRRPWAIPLTIAMAILGAGLYLTFIQAPPPQPTRAGTTETAIPDAAPITAPATATATATDTAPATVTAPATATAPDAAPVPNPTGSRILAIPDAGPWTGDWQHGGYLLPNPLTPPTP